MARDGAGVSVTRGKGGRWRVQWREVVVEAGQARHVHRERSAASETEARKLQGRILEMLERGEVPSVELAREATRAIRGSCTVDDMVDGWIRDRASRGYSANTMEGAATETNRILRGLRTIAGIPEGRAVPVGCLTRDAVIRLREALTQARDDKGRPRYTTSTIAGTIGTLVAVWTWASDDPVTYPGVIAPPRDTRSLRPRVAPSVAAEAPTLAECDAVIRIVANLPRTGRVALPAAVLGRMTGLRVSQALGIEVDDVNLAGCTLVVRIGKSAAERAERRTIPIHEQLRDWLTPYVARALAEGRTGLFLRRSDTKGSDVTMMSPPDKTLRRAWELATQAGEARVETWKPEGRAIGRPDHVFRAAFQDHLVRAGVRDEVIDLLVGHHPKTTRGRHYVGADARMEAMRDAIAHIPPIDWRKAEEVPDNVVAGDFGGSR